MGTIVRLLRSIDRNTGYPTDLTNVESKLEDVKERLGSIEDLLRDILGGRWTPFTRQCLPSSSCRYLKVRRRTWFRSAASP
jgi:hypothetical protein